MKKWFSLWPDNKPPRLKDPIRPPLPAPPDPDDLSRLLSKRPNKVNPEELKG